MRCCSAGRWKERDRAIIATKLAGRSAGRAEAARQPRAYPRGGRGRQRLRTDRPPSPASGGSARANRGRGGYDGGPGARERSGPRPERGRCTDHPRAHAVHPTPRSRASIPVGAPLENEIILPCAS
jgi:hypothetical protein